MVFELGETHAERVDVSNAMYERMCEIEDAELTLRYMWEEYFGKTKQEAINSWTTEQIGRTIRYAADAIYNVLLDFHLETGDSDWRGVSYQVERAKRVLEIQRASELVKKVNNVLRNMAPGAVRDAYDAEMHRAIKLPDAEAISALEVLLKEVKA